MLSKNSNSNTNTDKIQNNPNISIDRITTTTQKQSEVTETTYNKSKPTNDEKIVLLVKTFTAKVLKIQISINEPILKLKDIIYEKQGCPQSQQKLIYVGKQLQQNRLISDYNFRNQATVHLVLRLSGDIGIFGHYQNTIHGNILANYSSDGDLKQNVLSEKQVSQLIFTLKGSQLGHFSVSELEMTENQRLLLASLKNYADQQYEKLIKLSSTPEQIQDLKIYFTRQELASAIGQQLIKKYQNKFIPNYTTIILRRCSSQGKQIKFHIDQFSYENMQISLNNDTQYKGGKLIYASEGKLHIPKRSFGTITVHDNRIVHAVTNLQSGVRYGLFFLRK